MLTTEQIVSKCHVSDAPAETVADMLAIQEKGHAHGKAATYTRDDFTTENLDWYWDVGVDIERIEESRGMREGTLLRIYRAAFREGRRAGRIERKAAKVAA